LNAPPRVRPRPRAYIVDCDVHITARSAADLYPWLPARWRQPRRGRSDPHIRGGLYNQEPHPPHDGARHAGRRLSGGGRPPPVVRFPAAEAASRSERHRVRYADRARRGIFEERNQHFAEALSCAINDWQGSSDGWTRTADWSPRSSCRRRMRNLPLPRSSGARPTRDFGQILLSPKAQEPLGRNAVLADLRRGRARRASGRVSPRGDGRRTPVRRAGWPTYYLEEHNTFGTIMQGVLTSMIFEGVFRTLSKSESGFGGRRLYLGAVSELAYGQALVAAARGGCRMCESRRRNICAAMCGSQTQPMEETRKQAQLRDVIDWLGWDRLMFSSDYPHWISTIHATPSRSSSPTKSERKCSAAMPRNFMVCHEPSCGGESPGDPAGLSQDRRSPPDVRLACSTSMVNSLPC